MLEIVAATRNEGKLKEFRELLAGLPIRLLTVADFPGIPEVAENGNTFAENARLKAEAMAAETGLIAVADDSGLEVDALQGAPGVRSARFAGEPGDDRKNNEKLLELLRGVPPERRTARFRCLIAIAVPGEETYFSDGTCEGYIGLAPRGTNGFGYDPLFLVPEFDRTFAELDPEEKNRISHRGRALKQAQKILRELAGRQERRGGDQAGKNRNPGLPAAGKTGLR
jgi:XTP/dITP diphosphohydrolase